MMICAFFVVFWCGWKRSEGGTASVTAFNTRPATEHDSQSINILQDAAYAWLPAHLYVLIELHTYLALLGREERALAHMDQLVGCLV